MHPSSLAPGIAQPRATTRRIQAASKLNTTTSRTKRRSIGDGARAAAAAAASSAAMEVEEEEELEVTSAPVATAKEPASPAISYRFPTPRIASSSRVRPRPEVPNVHESSRKLISRGVTRFVLGLSSYIDGKLLKRCSGFVIDWDENNRSGTVFTSAHLICSSSPWDEWSGQHEYAPDAEVRVHLGEEIAVRGQSVYYNRHYGFALIGTEKIYLMSDIVDTGLIVEEVSAGSVAEKHGVRKGDIVKSLDGRCVDTTAALESMLLGMCVDRFDNGHDLDSSMDVTLGMFFTSGSVHGTMKFTVNASNDVEVFARPTYNVSDDQDLSTSSSMSPDEASEDEIW
ncbi:hypothetical protein HU200_061364 [Digitaria exilis]|uniref:PDZ domain-containing protein n=1 Tax=Digitaria exilis TaxID=1010633 RepID=A0A835A8L0_9POAL|nr:hypothetical protein HU200_061364 [Digitaria exilis]